VLDGRPDAAITLSRCQAVCVHNMDCTGLDWNPTASPGQRCWLSGPWSGGWRIGVAHGITHYSLIRATCRKWKDDYFRSNIGKVKSSGL